MQATGGNGGVAHRLGVAEEEWGKRRERRGLNEGGEEWVRKEGKGGGRGGGCVVCRGGSCGGGGPRWSLVGRS